MPGSTRWFFGGAKIVPFFTMKTLLDEPSVREPSRNMTTSTAPASAAN
jgi:hypothetical protein